MAAAAGALAHGQNARAVGLLQMAGEWRLALVVATASGDMAAVHRVVAAMAEAPGVAAQPEEVLVAQRVATALRGLYNSSGAHAHILVVLLLALGLRLVLEQS